MQTYTVKRIVVGILAAILLLGFCLAGTGALQPDRRPGGVPRVHARAGAEVRLVLGAPEG